MGKDKGRDIEERGEEQEQGQDKERCKGKGKGKDIWQEQR